MNNKQAGILIIVISISLAAVVYLFTIQLNSFIHSECVDELGFCPHVGTLPPVSYVAFTIVLVLGIFGVYMYHTGRSVQKLDIKEKEKIKTIISSLSGDDKTIYETIVQNQGTIFQSELIEETGLSKVKISRVLDTLEGKGLISRRRRGMSNVIVLKH